MTKVSVSTKIQSEVFEKLADTGYPISVIMQALINHFLKLPDDQQKDIVWEQTQRNIRERAIKKYSVKKD